MPNKGVWGREGEEGTVATRLWGMQKAPQNHLWLTASLRGTYWQSYSGSCLPKSCSVSCLPPCSNARNGFTAEGSTAIKQMEQKGKPESSQYPATVVMPSIFHRHHSPSWTWRLDPSFHQEFHSWWRQDWMKVHCGLQPEHSIPSLSCHVMLRPNLGPLPPRRSVFSFQKNI